MKNLIFLMSLFIMTATITPSKAQTLDRVKQGLTADSLKASTTYLTRGTNVNFGEAQLVTVQIGIDSVSGTPSGTATIQQSNDGTNWNTAATAVTWTTGVDTSFIVTVNPCLGAQVRTKIVTTSTTQKSLYKVTVRSAKLN